MRPILERIWPLPRRPRALLSLRLSKSHHTRAHPSTSPRSTSRPPLALPPRGSLPAGAARAASAAASASRRRFFRCASALQRRRASRCCSIPSTARVPRASCLAALVRLGAHLYVVCVVTESEPHTTQQEPSCFQAGAGHAITIHKLTQHDSKPHIDDCTF